VAESRLAVTGALEPPAPPSATGPARPIPAAPGAAVRPPTVLAASAVAPSALAPPPAAGAGPDVHASIRTSVNGSLASLAADPSRPVLGRLSALDRLWFGPNDPPSPELVTTLERLSSDAEPSGELRVRAVTVLGRAARGGSVDARAILERLAGTSSWDPQVGSTAQEALRSLDAFLARR
jgi:hypothetical protein